MQNDVVFEGSNHLSHVTDESAVDRERTVREGFLQVLNALKDSVEDLRLSLHGSSLKPPRTAVCREEPL